MNGKRWRTRALATERMARKRAGHKRVRDSLANERTRVALRKEKYACNKMWSKGALGVVSMWGARTRKRLLVRSMLSEVSPMSEGRARH